MKTLSDSELARINLEFMKRAKKVRHFIAENPGSTYRDILAALFPLKCPVIWLLKKNYIYRKGGGDSGPVQYYVKPMEEFYGDDTTTIDAAEGFGAASQTLGDDL